MRDRKWISSAGGAAFNQRYWNCVQCPPASCVLFRLAYPSQHGTGILLCTLLYDEYANRIPNPKHSPEYTKAYGTAYPR